MYEARIELDSISETGARLTTFVVTMPRIVLAELNTHRMLTKSSASSRAIPVEKQIARIKEDPFIPIYWGKNQKGMQAELELTRDEALAAEEEWLKARDQAIAAAERLLEIGVHKQITSRLLEPFMWHTVIITGTEWSNFFHLRDNALAQPELQRAARMMNELYRSSRPRLRRSKDWHLPFFSPDGDDDLILKYLSRDLAAPITTKAILDAKIFCAVGRCARVSYLTHDGKRDVDKDIELGRTCLRNGHMTPFEHAAYPVSSEASLLLGSSSRIPGMGSTFSEPKWIAGNTRHMWFGNFDGWVSARKTIHAEHDILGVQS